MILSFSLYCWLKPRNYFSINSYKNNRVYPQSQLPGNYKQTNELNIFGNYQVNKSQTKKNVIWKLYADKTN